MLYRDPQEVLHRPSSHRGVHSGQEGGRKRGERSSSRTTRDRERAKPGAGGEGTRGHGLAGSRVRRSLILLYNLLKGGGRTSSLHQLITEVQKKNSMSVNRISAERGQRFIINL